MKTESTLRLDPRMHAALKELETVIRQHYPEARFRVSCGEGDPTIVQLVATIDVEDTDPVLDVIMERLLELQAEDLPVFVVTERPFERTVAMRETAQAQKRVSVSSALF
jgi:hypothetical protein